MSTAAAPPDPAATTEPRGALKKEAGENLSSPSLPPAGVKLEVKKEESNVKDVKGDENDEEEEEDDDEGGPKEGPCTKMTMRLRRNINNPQFVRTTHGAVVVDL